MNHLQNNNGSSLTGKLHHCIMQMVKNSIDLREALTQRSSDMIWEILARQEEQASLLDEYSQLFNQLDECRQGVVGDEEQKLRDKMKFDLNRLKSIQKSNSILAHSFLSAVRKAMNAGGRRNKRASLTYNRRGYKGRKSSSVIVNRTG